MLTKMRKLLLLSGLTAVTGGFWLAAQVSQALPTMMPTGDGRTRMLVAGHGGPVVVLDTFGEMSLEGWGTIQWRCAKFSRVVTYDHRGTGGSDAGPKPRDARQIATELHELLHAAQLPPPYVLVGYSFGGPYLRVFAGLYPQEVSAMVLVDPSQEAFFDWLKIHHPAVNRITPADLSEQKEWGCSWASLNEAREAKFPPIPLTLITAMRPFESKLWSQVQPKWLEYHEQWLRRIPGAKHIVTEGSDHGIIWEEPDLVVRTIKDAVNQVSSPVMPAPSK